MHQQLILLGTNGDTLQQQMLLLAPLALISLALIAVALIDLARRPKEGVRGNKLLWAIVIVCIGTVGPISYLLVGRKEV